MYSLKELRLIHEPITKRLASQELDQVSVTGGTAARVQQVQPKRLTGKSPRATDILRTLLLSVLDSQPELLS